jgi:hypothetical protein
VYSSREAHNYYSKMPKAETFVRKNEVEVLVMFLFVWGGPKVYTKALFFVILTWTLSCLTKQFSKL